MRGCSDGKSPEKDAEKTDVRVKEGASTLNPTLPSGRKRPGGEFRLPAAMVPPPGFSRLDSMRWCAMCSVLIRKGFGDLWRKWLDAGS